MTRWTNWAGDQACEPVSIVRPGTLDSLRKAVVSAVDQGHRVRASASGHSFTDCALTDGVMVRLDGLTRKLDFDRESGLFKVEAGSVLHDLNRLLDADGVAFENLGDIDRQTVAGSVATGTHGTGERFQNVSAQVAGFEVIAPDGSLITIDESEPDLLRAARVAMGSLGIVYSVTVRTVPAYTINRVDSPKPLGEVLESLDELNAGTDHFEFYVFPGTDVALCRESRRTDEEPRPKHPALVFAQEVMLENWVGQAFAAAVRLRPSLAPTVAKLAARGLGRSTKIDERHIKFTEMEYAVPRERGRELIEGVLEIAAEPELHVAWPIEVRFVKGDDSFLSPSHEQDTCYVAVHQDTKLDWESYMRKVESLARGFGGRPHWGKRHFREAEDLSSSYPRWSDFQAVRKRLDPEGAFANAYTDRVLGPAA
jgi:L-gulonolactone oxidase